MIVTTQEFDALNDLVAQMSAMVAREDQRSRDKVAENELRATIRKADEKRLDGIDFRLDRVQASIEEVSRNLDATLNARVSDAAALRRQSDEIVARIDRTAEKAAADLLTTTETVAEKVAILAVDTAAILKEREDGVVVKKALSNATWTIIAFSAIALFAVLAFAVFEQRDDLARDIGTGIAAMAAVVGIVVYATRRKA
jgi:hypothetical protein